MRAGLFRRLVHYSSAAIARVYQIRPISSMANPKPDAEQQVDGPRFTSPEEALGLTASKGFGYFQASSVWLARDRIDNVHVAIKILKGYSTRLNHEHKLRELEVLQRFSSVSPDPGSYHDHCTSLLSQFVHPGIDQDEEPFALDSLSSQEGLPVPAVKRISKHVLLGIARLHECGIVHTDIKPDNMMVALDPHWTTEAIDAWTREKPPRTYAPERSLNRMVSAFVSKSLTPPSIDALSSCNFKLADYSSAQFLSDQTTDNITPLGLRPPEIVLGGEWNEAVDIWTFGCVIFTLLTNRTLFYPKASVEYDASETDVLLYQMISFCGEFFTGDFLRRCSRSTDYFEQDCRLTKFQSYGRKTFEECILTSGCILDPRDMADVTDFMTKCLRIGSCDRPGPFAAPLADALDMSSLKINLSAD